MQEKDRETYKGGTDKEVTMICRGCNTFFETNHPEWFSQKMVRGQMTNGRQCPRGCGSQRIFPKSEQPD